MAVVAVKAADQLAAVVAKEVAAVGQVERVNHLAEDVAMPLLVEAANRFEK